MNVDLLNESKGCFWKGRGGKFIWGISVGCWSVSESKVCQGSIYLAREDIDIHQVSEGGGANTIRTYCVRHIQAPDISTPPPFLPPKSKHVYSCGEHSLPVQNINMLYDSYWNSGGVINYYKHFVERGGGIEKKYMCHHHHTGKCINFFFKKNTPGHYWLRVPVTL